jgi:hypothetical protein
LAGRQFDLVLWAGRYARKLQILARLWRARRDCVRARCWSACGEGASIFPDAIKTGELTRTTFETSKPRVRVYYNVALVTTKVKTSGMLGGKSFDVQERQTDVWLWKDAGWKCVLTHETKIPDKEG